MKGIVKKATAVVLAVTVMCGTTFNFYQDTKASALAPDLTDYAALLSFLESVFMVGGASLGLDMLLKTQNDINNWDWGEVLGDPATQGQIDDAESKINEWYDNAVKDWYKNHGGSSEPTPTPGTSPPVTVAPINPDDLDIPEDWATLKKNATDKGILAMGAATAYCVKEAVKGWWDDIMDTEAEFQTSDTKNPYSYADCIGYQELRYDYNGNGDYVLKVQVYDKDHVLEYLQAKTISVGGHPVLSFEQPKFPIGQRHIYNFCSLTLRSTNKFDRVSDFVYGYNQDTIGTFYYMNQTYHFFVPVVGSNGDVIREAETKPLGKSSMWPSIDTKDDYDNNRTLPSPIYPNLAVPSIKLPSLDEIKDLWKQGTDDSDNRPTYVTNFITNHTVQATPTPEPTKKPEVNPNPGGGTDPDPEPTPSTTPAVVPDPGGGTDPQPSGSPDPNPDPGGGGDTDPDNPETPTPEEEASPYKTDLREIFPFCIPFDLIHLLKVFDAEAEAPVFEFPLDIEMDNPWTGEKVVDYHHTFELDMADYEPVIKILRIFQVIFFIIALMLITRQQMIKG